MRSQTFIGRADGTRTTPHMYVIDQEGVLRYHGAYSNVPRGTPAEGQEKSKYFQNAIQHVLSGEVVNPTHVQPWGCSVKYAPGT